MGYRGWNQRRYRRYLDTWQHRFRCVRIYQIHNRYKSQHLDQCKKHSRSDMDNRRFLQSRILLGRLLYILLRKEIKFHNIRYSCYIILRYNHNKNRDRWYKIDRCRFHNIRVDMGGHRYYPSSIFLGDKNHNCYYQVRDKLNIHHDTNRKSK
jgi:hypothetical protein